MRANLGSNIVAALLAGLGVATPALAATPVFVSTTGSDAATAACPANLIGTLACPAASIAKGVALASPGGEVRVAAGHYTGPLQLRDGVTIVGGYASKFEGFKQLSLDELKSLSGKEQDYQGHTRLSAGKGDDRVVVASGIKTKTALRNMVLFGPDLAGKSGRSSYVIVAQDSTALQLDSVKLVAGHGEAGMAGEAGAKAAATCTHGGGGGWTRQVNQRVTKGSCMPQMGAGDDICNDGTFQYCSSDNGNPGDADSLPGLGGTPGTAGHNDFCLSTAYGPPDGPIGTNGNPGKAGLTGLAGKAGADRAGAFKLTGGVLEWEARITGGPGARGMAGDGGGGGGAGGGRHGTFTFFTLSYTQCDIKIMQGGPGGAGGEGGCGGEGGKGGGAGGASFGLVFKDAKVFSTNVAILKAEGGVGGVGGAGGAGKAGSPGAEGKPGDTYTCRGYTYNAGAGAKGGDGSEGGSGGGGAGGNGGPSVALALIGNSTHEAQGLFHVDAGRGGIGGDGGNAAGAIHGDSGEAGLNAGTQQFKLLGTK
jgi:hypothetical protein